MIVLPILLYPLLLLGISRLVIYQSMQIKGKPARVVLTGVPREGGFLPGLVTPFSQSGCSSSHGPRRRAILQ